MQPLFLLNISHPALQTFEGKQIKLARTSHTSLLVLEENLGVLKLSWQQGDTVAAVTELPPACQVHFTPQITLYIFWFHLTTTPSSSGPSATSLSTDTVWTSPVQPPPLPHTLVSALQCNLPQTSNLCTLSHSPPQEHDTFKVQLRSCSDLRKTASQLSATPCFGFCTELGHPRDLWKEHGRSHPLLHTPPGLHPSPVMLAGVKEDTCITRPWSFFLSCSLHGGKS